MCIYIYVYIYIIIYIFGEYLKYIEIRGTKELDPGIDRTHIFPKNGSTDGTPGKKWGKYTLKIANV